MRYPALASTLFLAACAGEQSSLDPAGPAAESIHRLGIYMYVGATVVTLLVVGLMLAPLLHKGERAPNRKLFLWGGGVILPCVTLAMLLPLTFMTGGSMRATPPEGAVRIEVTGHMFWWDVVYVQPDGARVRTANEMRIPVGEPVEIILKAEDVIHSFWVPSLAGKVDMIPGRTNRMTLQADKAGVYRGQCAEYCGLQHALMAFYVIATPRTDFDAWLAALIPPRPEPATAELIAGRELYTRIGCATCHEVRGVSDGRIGPDLTDVGSRRSIGAGALPGGLGSIAGWIASTQHLKPGANMPSYDQLSGPELRAIAAYMDSLK